MIFADKLIQLRKKAGWSQEELAEQMNVSRQSVSKWEGAQSIPDLDKMVRLSEMFGVSTDYLLKDDIEETEVSTPIEEISNVRRVSMEEASAFLAAKKETARLIARGVFLCIISPICVIILGAMSEIDGYKITGNTAAGIGMIVLLVIVAIAVALFVLSGSKTSSFEYIEKEVFETAYGVKGMVEERRATYKDEYTRNNIIGVFMCVVSLAPLFAGIIINENNTLLMVAMVAVMLVLIAIGVEFFVRGGIIWSSFAKLLQEGDYTKQKKAKQPFVDALSSVYWLLVTAVYLLYSFKTNGWERSWIIWVVAGLLYPVALAIVNVTVKKK